MKTREWFKGFLASLMLMLSASVSAVEFELDGIHYRTISSTTVSVYYSEDDKCVGAIVIPSSVSYESKTYDVTRINDNAFSDCSALTSIEIPNSVISIEEGAFSGCSSLTSIEIPNSVTSIGRSAFSGCSSLISIEIPNRVTEINENTFASCSALSSIKIPNSVTKIFNYAFFACSSLTSIEFPNTVTEIGWCAFQGCSSLTTIKMSNSVIRIDSHTFQGCSSLTSIEIPNSVTEIDTEAFSGCSSLTSIEIPNSVVSIGNRVFYDCSGLTSIKVAADNTIYDSREDCNAIILTSKNRLITGCAKTKIPNDVTVIGTGAFYGCTGMTFIEIPNSVTNIGPNAFLKCTGLKDIYCTNHIPCIFNENMYVFDETHYTSATLHVPAGSLAAYQTADGWKNFKNIVEEAAAYATYAIHAVSVNELYGTVAIENGGEEVIEGTSVTVTAEPKAGYKFTNWMEGDVVVSSENPYTFEAAKDINLVAHFAPATYKVTYIVDGEEYKVIEVTYGEAIPAEAEPTKEGYIFSGWSEIPETMPAEDVTITGTFVFDYNADAYQRLNSQIAELQNSLNAAKETINTECADVTAQFVEQITSIQNSIDALSADVKAKYEAGELSAESNIDTASVVAAIEKLLADAQSAQQAYEAEQEKIAANEAAYTKLMQEIAELQAKLDAAKETINAECKDVAAQFAEQLANIQSAIDALLNDINAQYANCALTAESVINVADIVETIKTTTEAAAEAQKEYEETVGIEGVGSNGAKVKAIYNLNGKRVSTTKPNQLYIIEYSDGKKVKAIVKK